MPKVRMYNLQIDSIEINENILNSFDCVLLLTDHDIFPYEMIRKNSRLIIDTRGRFKSSENIIKA